LKSRYALHNKKMTRELESKRKDKLLRYNVLSLNKRLALQMNSLWLNDLD
jgi:hypothetical protein